MIIGFSGTQHGMTSRQLKAFEELLSRQSNTPKEFHHGDCEGADEQAHFVALRLGCKIIIHPPLESVKRAFCHSKYIEEAKPYLIRNHDIVDAVDFFIVAPRTQCEQARSGTWATIRYARPLETKTIFYIFPNGVVVERAARLKIKYRLVRKV